MYLPLTLLCTLVLCSLPTSISAQASWASDLDTALAAAKEQKQLLYIAVHAPGHRDSDRAEAQRGRDRGLKSWLARTITVYASHAPHGRGKSCKVCKGLKCAQHQAIAVDVATRILKRADPEDAGVPQHLLCDASGKVLFAAPMAARMAELEWMFWAAHVEAQLQAGEQPKRSHAPVGLLRGKGLSEVLDPPPPTDQQVQSALEKLRSLGSRGGRRGARGGAGRGMRERMAELRDLARTVLYSARKDALDWGRATLGNRWFRGALLDQMEAIAPAAWIKPLEGLLTNRRSSTRRQAAQVIEAIADKSAAGALKRALRKEDRVLVRADLLRALAASDPAATAVGRALHKELKKDKENELLRAHLMMAARVIEGRKMADPLLLMGLEDRHSLVRRAAAHAVAVRMDVHLRDKLSFFHDNESDADTKAYMAKALEALRSRDPAAIAGFRPEGQEEEESERSGAPQGGPGAPPKK